MQNALALVFNVGGAVSQPLSTRVKVASVCLLSLSQHTKLAVGSVDQTERRFSCGWPWSAYLHERVYISVCAYVPAYVTTYVYVC